MPEWKAEILKRLAGLKLEPAREMEIVDELSQHMDDRYEELLTNGATPEIAHQTALAELNDHQLLTQELRRVARQVKYDPIITHTGRTNMIGDLWQDLRYAVRMLRKQPGFTLVAVLTLALGIGANTAIFQLLDAVRLRTLPVKSPQELAEVRLVSSQGTRGNKTAAYPSVTNPIWEQIRDQQQSFSDICAWGTGSFNLAQGGEVRPARALWVSGDFFNVLGVQPMMGRLFTKEDDQRGSAAPGVVISYAFWQQEYGGDANVIGQKVMLADHPFEIIGVTPANFFGLEVGQSFDLALPICADAIVSGQRNRLDSGTNWWLMVTGRLKPGRTLAQATADLQAMSSGLFAKTLPVNYPPVSVNDYLAFKLEAVSAAAGYSTLRANYEDSLWLLLVIAGLVLLIACANLANLLLARASAREREMAVRQALGASRQRLVRQLLAESMLLAIVGAGLGALLAQSLSQFLVAFLNSGGNTIFLNLEMDWRILGFAAGMAAITCLLFGLMPAIRAARIEPGVVMKANGRGMTAGRQRFTVRRALVVLQVALSLVLVAGAFLFTRSLNKLLTVDTGFQPDGILITQVGFARLNIPLERRLGFKHDTLEQIRAIPGVEAASDTSIVPLSGDGGGNNVWMDGTDREQKINTSISHVSPDYFKTMGTPLLFGRDFNDHDTPGTPSVAIVNETFARQLLHGANPVGHRFWIEATPNDPETVFEIVGMVKDTKYEDLREDLGPLVFLAIMQYPPESPNSQLLIRANLQQAELTANVKRVLNGINPGINVRFKGFKSMIEGSVLRERLLATLSGFFGLLALLLASIGLYGLLSYSVASRTNEIGIRMALGAQARDVLWLILRESLLLVVIGVAVGAPMILAVTRLASSLLFGLTGTDPVSFGLAAALMLAVGLLACWIPARRATRVDPLVALRYE